MKIIFLGTPDMARFALERLYGSRHEVVAVITQPDRESGRGRQTLCSPVKNFTIDKNIPCLQPEKIGDAAFLDELEKIEADIMVVVAYAQKLPGRLLEMKRYGCINIHPSLLPKYRGAAPFRGPILNGDKVSGVTIMNVVEKWDAGDILLQREFAMDGKETAATLEEKAKVLGSSMLIEVIDGLEAGTVTPVPQDESHSTYIKQIKKEDGRIDFSQSATEIERQIRACIPWPSAYAFLDGKMLKIWDADVWACGEEAAGSSAASDEACAGPAALRSGSSAVLDGAAPGQVVFSDKNTLAISCGEGFLKVTEPQLEGKKRMLAGEFLRGRKIEAGTVLE